MLYTSRSRTGKRTTALHLAVMAVSLASAMNTVAANDGMPPAVRSSDRVLNELIADGYRRSQSFRRLVDGIAETNTLVYVEAGVCTFGHLKACLLPVIATAGQVRYLRIGLTRPLNLGNRNRLIALIGHELQHALEVAARPDVINLASMIEMYRRIGVPLKGQPGYETSAARAAGDAVLDELTKKKGPSGPIRSPRQWLLGRAG
jgi:hypothetical protein